MDVGFLRAGMTMDPLALVEETYSAVDVSMEESPWLQSVRPTWELNQKDEATWNRGARS